jgi:hypothetical protein
MPRPTDKQLSNAIHLLEQQTGHTPFLWQDTVLVVVEWMRRMHASRARGWRMVCQRAHTSASCGRDPRSSGATKELTAGKGN